MKNIMQGKWASTEYRSEAATVLAKSCLGVIMSCDSHLEDDYHIARVAAVLAKRCLE
jgi:hypothetical protein